MACPEETDLPGVEDPLRNRNIRDSVRLLNTKPDILQRNVVSCYCGNEIDRRSDWHVMMADGTLSCRVCANCSRCKKAAVSINGRLICMDGLVFCHACLIDFGYQVQQKFRIVHVNDKNEETELQQKNNDNNSMVNLSDDLGDPKVDQSDLLSKILGNEQPEDHPTAGVNPKKDGRRTIRVRRYPRPGKIPNELDDKKIHPPPYDALKGIVEKSICPNCEKKAEGSEALVIPSIATVYHIACFRCSECDIDLTMTEKRPMIHFQSCTCKLPKVWCTFDFCMDKRKQHHEENDCHLAPVRPGGM